MQMIPPEIPRPRENGFWGIWSIHNPESSITLDETGNLERRYIAIGSNDGMFHVFTDMDIPSLGYSAGDEIFAFVPEDLLISLKELASTATHIYMVDGSPNLFVSPTFDDANTNGQRDAGEYSLQDPGLW